MVAVEVEGRDSENSRDEKGVAGESSEGMMSTNERDDAFKGIWLFIFLFLWMTGLLVPVLVLIGSFF